MNVETEHGVLFAGPFKTSNLGLKLELRSLLRRRLLLWLIALLGRLGGLCLRFAGLLGSVGMRLVRGFGYGRCQGCRLLIVAAFGA